MLTDLIGVAIGFVVIMLFLSLIVASLAQATQALLRLRGRNLRIGIAAALSRDRAWPDQESLNDASDILNRCDDAGLRRASNATSLLSRVLGPAVGWLDSKSLAGVLRERAIEMTGSSEDDISDEEIKEINDTVKTVVDRFESLDKPLKNRFEIWIRGVSLIWAVVVAAVFQVNTPDLIHELSINPEYRAQIIAQSPIPIVDEDEEEEVVEEDEETEDVEETEESEEVEESDELEEPEDVENVGEVEEEVEEEVDEAEEVEGDVAEEEASPTFEEAVSLTEDQIEQLALIDIRPLRYGVSYYTEDEDRASNIFGVLLTAILLTLGAPFWYDLLKEIVRWRNVFAPNQQSNSEQNNNGSNGDGNSGNARDG